MYPIQIIGIGQGKKDLTQRHLEMIETCDVLVGGKRHLEMFNQINVETILITGHLDDLIDSLKEKMNHKKIVVLASGDPLFHGIGSTICQRLKPKLDPESVEIYSNISSISAAFAKIKEPWHDVKIISLHGPHQDGFSFSQLADEYKVAFLTDKNSNPNFIAKQLLKSGLYDFRFCVLENLGNEDTERITWFENIDLICDQSFSHPNIVILMKSGKPPKKRSNETHIGMKDTLFKHSKGLITKSEIRSISLSKLKLIHKDHVLWDIGSGSGSVGIEASFLIPWGHVYAIEKNADRISDIIYNIKNFNCSNVKVLNAVFPDGADDLETPDRIFIGGGGQHLKQIIEAGCLRLEKFGIIVINTVLLQNLETAMALLKKHHFAPEVVQIQVSRSKQMPFGDRFEALNPVWIITGTKPDPKKPGQTKPDQMEPDER
ncbi:MAG: precorrin-6y C5,15-methyltransferase (decarboxylating) subunit CbiE [Desulfobacula sp.]|nr:precorrin-6y C5,15-methyltransferase (decarboxylating) subunit CbiE [Desulfobacula sp.]